MAKLREYQKANLKVSNNLINSNLGKAMIPISMATDMCLKRQQYFATLVDKLSSLSRLS